MRNNLIRSGHFNSRDVRRFRINGISCIDAVVDSSDDDSDNEQYEVKTAVDLNGNSLPE